MILLAILSSKPDEAQGQKFEKCWEEALSLTHHMWPWKTPLGQTPGVDDMYAKQEQGSKLLYNGLS